MSASRTDVALGMLRRTSLESSNIRSPIKAFGVGSLIYILTASSSSSSLDINTNRSISGFIPMSVLSDFKVDPFRLCGR